MIPAVQGVGLEPRVLGTPAIASGGGATGFVEALGRALESVDAMQRDANAVKAAVASGDRVDMAQAVTTIERANVAFQLALQVRNKLLEAYQDVMRMQV